jgi:hypothetical protein
MSITPTSQRVDRFDVRLVLLNPHPAEIDEVRWGTISPITIFSSLL